MTNSEISKFIERKSGIEWNPNKVFESYNDALDFKDMVESNSSLECTLVQLDGNQPFGKHKVKIN